MGSFLPWVLKRRHIEHIGACNFCGNNDESIFHAIISCPSITAIWKVVNDATRVKLPRLHPKTWAPDIIGGKVCSSMDVETITIAVYVIWTAQTRDQFQKRSDQRSVSETLEQTPLLGYTPPAFEDGCSFRARTDTQLSHASERELFCPKYFTVMFSHTFDSRRKQRSSTKSITITVQNVT